MILVNEQGAPVEIGAKIVSFRGEVYWLQGGRPPRHSGSSGYVWVVKRKKDLKNDLASAEYYPSVFDLKWVA